MRRMLIWALAMGMSVMAVGQDKEKDDDSGSTGAGHEVAKIDDEAREAALKGDASFLEKYLADNYVGVNPLGQVATKQDVINMRKNGEIKYTAIDQHKRTIHEYGNAVLVTSEADVKGTRKGQDMSGTYRSSRVWVKRNGTWQQVLFQSTRVQGDAH